MAFKGVFPIIGEPTNSESSAPNKTLAQAQMISTDDFNVQSIIKGKYKDQEVLEKVAKEFKTRFNVTGSALNGSADAIKAKAGTLTKLYFDGGVLTAEGRQKAEKLIDAYFALCKESDKKKQPMTESQANNNIAS